MLYIGKLNALGEILSRFLSVKSSWLRNYLNLSKSVLLIALWVDRISHTLCAVVRSLHYLGLCTLRRYGIYSHIPTHTAKNVCFVRHIVFRKSSASHIYVYTHYLCTSYEDEMMMMLMMLMMMTITKMLCKSVPSACLKIKFIMVIEGSVCLDAPD